MFILSFFPKARSFGINTNLLRNSCLLTGDLKKLQYKSFSKTPTKALRNPRIQNDLLMINKVNNRGIDVLKQNFSTSTAESNASPFKQILNDRKKQAHCSVLLELSKKDDIPYALSSCERFGIIKKAYSFSGLSNNVYVLLEFEEEAQVKELLQATHFKNVLDVFPVLSRIVGYTKKYDQEEPKVSINVIEDTVNPIPIKEGTVSDLIENIYNEEKLTEFNVRLRFFFCCILKESLSGLFPYCDAIPFGSSVNGIGRHGCDLDLMIRLYPEKIDSTSELYFVNKTCVGDLQKLQKMVVNCIGDLLRTFSPGITAVQKILHARVPIVKLDHKILGMKVDISVNNMAPILMSELLYFCGEVDSRIRPLIYAVKKWAREVNVTYDLPGSWLTNFALTLLVVYFLQNRPTPVLPPLNDIMNIMGAEFTDEYRIEFLMTLSELQAKAGLNKESIAVLLQEFLAYLGSHPFEDKHISLLTGSATEKVSPFPLWIQYPFEEDLNVSKNVSQYELWDACEKARASAKFLSSNLNARGAHMKDLSVLLGIPNIRKLEVNKSKRLDVNSLLGEEVKSLKKSGRVFR